MDVSLQGQTGDIRRSLPLVVHVIHELSVGGLENGLVNLINRMPEDRYRHAIVCMTRCSDFRARITRSNVQIVALDRESRSIASTYWKLFRLFRRLRPAIVHSRNLSGLDALMPAVCARVPVRIHGEHGRDVDDLDGSNQKNLRLKRIFRPLVTQHTAVSRDLAEYLHDAIGVPVGRIVQIYNGVDTDRFRPASVRRIPPGDRAGERRFVVGTVGRLQPVKDQVSLVRAFALALRMAPDVLRDARLRIVGDGPLRNDLECAIASESLTGCVDLLGARDDVDVLLREMDLFALPSIAEGISNTLLEAMATGLPAVATRVGGNADLVQDGVTGAMVAPRDPVALAQLIVAYAADEERRAREGTAARARAERVFGIDAMVKNYMTLYDRLIRWESGLYARGRMDPVS